MRVGEWVAIPSVSTGFARPVQEDSPHLSEFPEGITLKQDFARWRVTQTTIEDKDIYVVQSVPQAGQTPVSLYFDEESGLLVRLLRFTDTAAGRVPTQIDFSDYRAVQGTKLPFKITTTWTDGQSTIELADVQTNVAIDSARFRQPPPAAPFK